MITAANSIQENLSLEEFLEFPETKPASEYIDGTIEQKPMPKGEHSRIQTRLSAEINKAGESDKIALALTELRCTLGKRSIVPDISVFEWHRIPKTDKGRIANEFTVYPDWVIEILSPEQSANKVIKKILFCLEQGSKLGWLIDSEDESVSIFYPNKPIVIKDNSDILPILEVLDNWQLSVEEMFSWLAL